MIDKRLVDRFSDMHHTESDPTSETTPSTKQWDLANLLVKELKEMGCQDVA